MATTRTGVKAAFLLLFVCCVPCGNAQQTDGRYQKKSGDVFDSITGAEKSSHASKPKPRIETFTTKELAAKVGQSLALVVTEDREGNPLSQGSGYFITKHLVVTNLHVLKRAAKATVKRASGDIAYRVEGVAAFTLRHDICVLYVPDADGVPLVASSDDVAVGDDIMVAGNPEGLESTFSKGIVSAVRREAGMFQTDAPISHGSSGGPVVNMRGEVVGLATSSLVEGQNLNFAVSIRFLPHLLDSTLPVETMGHLAVTDAEDRGFQGPVRKCVESRSDYSYDPQADRYIKGPMLTTNNWRFNREGRMLESDDYRDGALTGRMLWSYSADGLMDERTDVDAEGREKKGQISPENAVLEQPVGLHLYDDSWSVKVNGETQVEKYDRMGKLVETDIPERDTKLVKKYDSHGRDVDDYEYRHGKLASVIHSEYEVNGYGDWTTMRETIWDAKFPKIGFTPLAVTTREITYYDAAGQ